MRSKFRINVGMVRFLCSYVDQRPDYRSFWLIHASIPWPNPSWRNVVSNGASRWLPLAIIKAAWNTLCLALVLRFHLHGWQHSRLHWM